MADTTASQISFYADAGLFFRYNEIGFLKRKMMIAYEESCSFPAGHICWLFG
jgi:hypothetical protein